MLFSLQSTRRTINTVTFVTDFFTFVFSVKNSKQHPSHLMTWSLPEKMKEGTSALEEAGTNPECISSPAPSRGEGEDKGGSINLNEKTKF